MVGPAADANFARRRRVFSASTTRPAREGPYARDDGPTRSPDFHVADAAAAAESGVPRARQSLRTFIYPFSTNESHGELLPSENFRVNKTTLTNTDPPFINCTDRAPNEAARLAETSRSSRRDVALRAQDVQVSPQARAAREVIRALGEIGERRATTLFGATFTASSLLRFSLLGRLREISY